MKKTFQFMSLILVVSLLISGCGGAAAPTVAPVEPPATTAPPATEVPTAVAEKVTITWFEHLSTEWGNEWFDKVTADFEAQTGIHVERISAPWGDLWPKMTTWMQSGEMPDIYGTYAGWTSNLFAAGAMADLTPLIPQLDDPAKFAADQGSMWPGIGQFGGKLVTVPWWLQSYGLFYNKEAFAEKGYTVPTTWAELRTLLETMKADGVPGMEMTWGTPADAGVHFTFLQWMWRALGAGGQLTDDSGNPAFNTPEGKLAMQYWYDLYNDGLLYPGSEAATVQQNRGDFCAGKTLMIVDGPWMGATCATMGTTFTVVMAPGLCGEQSCGNVVYPWELVVASNSAHPVEALKFIDFLTSDAVGSDFSKTFSISLANPIRYQDADYKDNPITGKMQALLETPGNMPLPPITNAEEVQLMVGTEWQKVLFGQQTVDEAIVSIETQWNAITAK